MRFIFFLLYAFLHLGAGGLRRRVPPVVLPSRSLHCRIYAHKF